MAYTEKTTTSYGSRVKNSFGGVVTGIVLFLAGTCLLWWNEGRAVKTAKMLEEAAEVAVDMENVKKIDPSYDGELVHATSMALTNDSLCDTEYGVGVTGIKLKRDVEYYQWVEHSSSTSEDKLGGSEETTTTYTYSMEWTNEPVNSGDFKDPAYRGKNSTFVLADDNEWTAENVTFGAYTCPESMINKITGWEDLQLSISPELLKQKDAQLARALGEKPVVKQPEPTAAVPDSAANDSNAVTEYQEDDVYENIHVAANQIYLGKSPNAPAIGDVRITYRTILPHKISIIAKVDGNTFKSYKAKNGKTMMMVVNGSKDLDEMIQAAEEGNNLMTWALRIIGILVVIGGLKGLFSFLSTVLKVVPFLSSMLNFGTSIICSVVGFVWSLLIIAIAWLFYRPILAICILAGVGLIVFLVVNRAKVKEKLNEAMEKK